VALIALIAGFVVVVVVVSSALSGNSGEEGSGRERPARTETKSRPPKKTPRVYVIENGDTLIAIAHATGVPVARIERLNPDVDPQILISGEKLKLR
jgi:LysM repeat protein